MPTVTDIIAQTLGATPPPIFGGDRGGPLTKPKKVVLSDDERRVVANVLRMTDDPFEDFEAGAGVPIGTLDHLLRRLTDA